MREVSVHRDVTVLSLHKSILESAGIACYIRNEGTPGLGAGMFGLVNSPIFEPVLCIMDDDLHEEAVAVLRDHLFPAANAGALDWVCASCGELIPASFDSCWNCEASRPEAGRELND